MENPMKKLSDNSDQEKEGEKLQVYLAEFSAIRDEFLQQTTFQQQCLALTFGLSAIAVPVLLSQQGLEPLFVACLLYLISIFTSVLGMNFASSMNSLGVFSFYIYNQLEPRINQLVNKNQNLKIMKWEGFITEKRKNPIFLFLHSIGNIGSILLMIVPGIASNLIAQYVINSAPINTQQQSLNLHLFALLVGPLSIVAWISNIVSVLSILAVVLIWAIQIQFRRS
jgi:hypothetical protein